MKKTICRWRKLPDQHDYPSAESYLSLIYDKASAAKFVKKLKSASIREFKAKDIFRASSLPLLGTSNSHVKTDLKKISNGEKVSPLLLVRQPQHERVIIADGYHRLCAVYSTDEDAVIPCKIV